MALLRRLIGAGETFHDSRFCAGLYFGLFAGTLWHGKKVSLHGGAPTWGAESNRSLSGATIKLRARSTKPPVMAS